MDEAAKLRQVIVPVADICKQPGVTRLRQLLFGEPVTILRDKGEHVKIRAARDGYEGVMARADLGPINALTHKVMALATHVYAEPNLKSRDLMSLSFGARLTVVEIHGSFGELSGGGFVPMQHVTIAHRRFTDPAGVAEMFLGTPYLWGGNSRLGLDCSGLVQAACIACGLNCPGDTQDQVRMLGERLDPQTPLRRGDLLFWKGHVALVSAPDRLIHANAHHMATMFENLTSAIQRIADQGGGPVTMRRRLNLLK